MSPDPRPATAAKNGVIVSVRVQPRAARPGIRGMRGDALFARLKAPPEKGRANKELITLLSDFFKVKKSVIKLKSGAASRTKRVLIKDVSLAEIQKRMQSLASGV